MKKSKIFKFSATITLLIALISSCTIKSVDERADRAMRKIVEESEAVGLAVAVVKDCSIIFSNSYGLKEIESETPLRDGDIFRIASISKSFTTTALMTLVERNLLSLEDDVSDLVGFTVRNPKYPDVVITLEQLLSHSASLNDSQGYFTLDVLNPEKNANYAECYNNYRPGTEYQYCNLAFNTIGSIVEKYADKRFDHYLSEVLFEPLNLEGGFNPDELDRAKYVTLYEYIGHDTTEASKAIYEPSPQAYASRAANLESNYQMGYSTPLFSPTGGVKISAIGLANYMTMHMFYGRDPKSGVEIISEESAKRMQNPIISSGEGEEYALALRVSKNLIPGERMVGHTGSAYGLYSAMFFEPEKGFGIVMITNGCSPTYKEGFMEIQLKVIRELYQLFIGE